MQLKIGELTKKTGLSVGALHHYDEIDLLFPSQRSEGSARLYGRDVLIRLHRMEALKRFDYSLPDIKATLNEQLDEAPLATLRRQITELKSQALKAQRLSLHLQHLVEMIVVGGETTTMN